MKISREDIHDKLSATYQSLEASILNRVLLEHGIEDRELRRKIVGYFLFEQGIILDQYWFQEDQKRWCPGIYFSTLPNDNLDGATVHLPSLEIGPIFHEYAFGAADWALDNESQPEPDVILTGNGNDP
jgi:hypothetical protein